MSQDEFTIPHRFIDHDHYRRVVKRMKINAKNTAEASRRYLLKIDEQLSSEMADLKAKIDQVGSEIESNGQQMLEEFRHRATENEGGNLNKLYQDLCNYKTSGDEIYGDEFRKFQAEKQNFMTQLVELRKKEKDKLATIPDQIERLNDNVKKKMMVFKDCRTLVTFEASDEERHRALMFLEEGGQDRTITTTTTS
ncbi:hypothetical protein ACJRO7_010071 [Eucalyptus globulus]|uniref:Uncharacterized protein n=1 Tax=Eucalyptus globulus TaxID=34317 RepID=A0ABD3LAT2_EUCGL